MKYIVIYNEDEIKGFECLEEVKDFYYEVAQSEVKDFCDEYEMDIEELSPERIDQISFACGYEVGEIKTYRVSDLLNIIDKMDIDIDEKQDLIEILKSNNLEGYINEYDYLEEVFYLANEVNINY